MTWLLSIIWLGRRESTVRRPFFNTGFQRPGFPGIEAWISYRLGTDESPDVCGHARHRGCLQWPQELRRCFSVTHHQATEIYPNREKAIHDLHAPSDAFVTPKRGSGLRLLKEANQEHRSLREGDQRLEARIRSYSWPHGCLSAPDAIDLRNEPQHILKLYGLDHGQTPFRSKSMNWRTGTTEENVWLPGGYWSAGFGLSKFGRAMTIGFHDETGIPTKTSIGIMAHWLWGWRGEHCSGG